MRKRVSNETFIRLLAGEKIKIVSFLPLDKPDCDCYSKIQDWTNKFGNMTPEQIRDIRSKGVINCERAEQEGYKNYEIICALCGDLIATVALKDGDINTYCNLHYVAEALLGEEETEKEEITYYKDKKKLPTKKMVKATKVIGEWHGCLTPSVSLMDGKLGFECACGNDTRDFRMAHLTNATTIAKMKENMNGRNFGEKNSKYILREIK